MNGSEILTGTGCVRPNGKNYRKNYNIISLLSHVGCLCVCARVSSGSQVSFKISLQSSFFSSTTIFPCTKPIQKVNLMSLVTQNIVKPGHTESPESGHTESPESGHTESPEFVTQNLVNLAHTDLCSDVYGNQEMAHFILLFSLNSPAIIHASFTSHMGTVSYKN